MKEPIKVLIIDDDIMFVSAVEGVLKKAGYEVLSAFGGEEGIKTIEANSDIGVVLLDLYMPDISGEEVLRIIRGKNGYSDIPVIIITADWDLYKGMELMNAGAANVKVKPFSADVIISAIRDEITPPMNMNYKEIGWTGVKYDPKKGDKLQGRSPAMRSLSEEIVRVARLDSTVLIIGETGTGKELVAKAIHEFSNRKSGPFVIIDCSALPGDEMLYGVLWGHEKGSFTGAIEKLDGRVLLAKGGTIFLDEVGAIKEKTQAQLLRFCETKQVWPLGSKKSYYTLDARIVSATNVDLREAVENGQFRADLYHRLSRNTIAVPPLRERRQTIETPETLKAGKDLPIFDDVEILIDYAMDRYNKTANRCLPVKGVEITAIERLKPYEWPGNIRQLNNVITEAASKASGRASNQVITMEDVESSASFRIKTLKPKTVITLRDLHKNMKLGIIDEKRFANKIEEILNMAGGNVTKASKIAGISRVTMYEYINEAKK